MSHVHDNPPPVGLDPAQSERRRIAREEAERHFAGIQPQWLDDADERHFELVLACAIVALMVAMVALHIGRALL